MDADAIARAIAALAPEAVAVVEQTLRSTGRADRTRVEAAWRVLRMAAEHQPGAEATREEVAALDNVLRMVEP